MEQFVVRSAVVELDGGQRLRVSRYADPATDREVLTLARTWLDDLVGIPTEGSDTLRLPADALSELVDALQELEGAGD